MEIEGFTPYPPQLVKEYLERGIWQNRTLGDVLDETVRRHPDVEALADERTRVTYREYGAKVDRLALHLLELGLKPGEMVTLQLPNLVEYCYFFFACAKIGVIAVPSLPQYRTRDMEYILNLTESVGVVVPRVYRRFDYFAMIEELRPRVKSLRHVFVVDDDVPAGAIAVRRLLEEPVERRYPAGYLAQFRPDPSDMAFLLWTGGTTAFPKGVPHTHNDYLCVTKGYGDLCERGKDVHYYLNIPVGHMVGTQMGVVASAMYSSKLVMAPSADTTEFLKAIEREKIGYFLIMPTQVVDLLNHPDIDKYDLSSLRVMAAGGANFAPELVRGVREKIGCTPKNVFGMAEGVCTCTRSDDPFEAICYTVGVPCCEWDEVRVVDEDHNEVSVGTEGEVSARGPHVFRGYFKAPEVNREAFDAEGWFYTGDYGRMDEAGRLTITGRKKDMIIRGGENIAAIEVEQPLLEHPKVFDVAIVGMPDARLGERVCAYILTRKGETITLEEVQEYLDRLGVVKYKWPERLELVEEFPLTNVGKIAKNVLRERIAQALKSEGTSS